MADPKTAALPLGDAPLTCHKECITLHKSIMFIKNFVNRRGGML